MAMERLYEESFQWAIVRLMSRGCDGCPRIRRILRGSREFNPEPRTAGRCLRYRDDPSVQIHQLSHDREADAAPGG